MGYGRQTLVWGIAAAAVLAGCSRAPQSSRPQSDAASAPILSQESGSARMPPAAAKPAPNATINTSLPASAGAPAAALPPAVPMLAYSYRYGFTLPASGVRAMMERHQRACENAGPLTCQVTAAEANTEGRDIARARLSMRAAPAWLKTFREGLESDAKGAGGKVSATSTTTEDLTRAIVDTEATNRARTVLRDRLERILAERPGDLSDALRLETEIARVQGEINASQSQLEVMRARVAMSDLNLDYRAEGVMAPEGVSSPLADAFRSFVRNMLSVFAVLVVLLSYLVPLALVGAPIAWLVMRWRRGRKRPAPTAKP